MYDGTLASKGPWQAIVTFQQMIVLADQDGVIDMTAHALSRRTSIPLEIIEAGIAALMEPDPDSRTPGEEGRRITNLEEHRNWGWRIVNHAKYRDMRKAEERREYLRVAQAKSRAGKKSTPVNSGQQVSSKINTSTHTEAYTEAEAETPASASPEDGFEDFWIAFPATARKAAKSQCRAKWVSRGCAPLAAVIVAHVKAMAATEQWRKDKGQFIPAPLVYLNQERWEAPTDGTQDPVENTQAAEHAAWLAKEAARDTGAVTPERLAALRAASRAAKVAGLAVAKDSHVEE